MIKLKVNGVSREFDGEPDMPLLWYLRDELQMTGTKYGCGAALCGACTVLVDGVATRSCSMPVEAAVGRAITTIEAIGSHPVGAKVVEAWVDPPVPWEAVREPAGGRRAGLFGIAPPPLRTPVEDEVWRQLKGLARGRER